MLGHTPSQAGEADFHLGEVPGGRGINRPTSGTHLPRTLTACVSTDAGLRACLLTPQGQFLHHYLLSQRGLGGSSDNW